VNQIKKDTEPGQREGWRDGGRQTESKTERGEETVTEAEALQRGMRIINGKH